MPKSFAKYFIITALIILVSSISLAQNSTSLFVCVSPEDSTQTPYTMAFQQTTAFGLLIPENADVVIYSTTEFTSSLYTINTDANSGGYRTLERLATIDNGTVIPIDIECGNQFQEELIAATYSTIPIPVSANHALLIELDEVEETNLTDALTVRGVLAFTFRLENIQEQESTDWFSFQILQISEVDPVIEFTVPSIPPNTPFSVISNKTFGIGQSQIGVIPPAFPPNLQPSNPRQFVQDDLRNIFNLNLFSIMEEGAIRIYPESGAYGFYNGAYFQLSIPTDIPVREFNVGTEVRALSGAEALFVNTDVLEDNPFLIGINFRERSQTTSGGRLLQDPSIADNTLPVARVDLATGQLIVQNSNQEAIIQSWLVEPVE